MFTRGSFNKIAQNERQTWTGREGGREVGEGALLFGQYLLEGLQLVFRRVGAGRRPFKPGEDGGR